MSYFAKELWNALTRPFKVEADGECRKWVLVLGSLLDDARESVLNIRRQWTIEHARGWVLDMRGAERDLPRWYNESDDDYRRRVRAAFALYAAGGTLPGMQRALKQIGYNNVLIKERSGPTWAHFLLTFYFPFGKSMGTHEWNLLNFSVWRMKPAHTMPRYFLNFWPNLPQRVEILSKPRIYGEIKVNHPALWTTKRFYFLNGRLTLNGSITLGDGWCEAVFLDGMQLMDSSALLDGFTAVEGDGWRWRDNPLHRPKIVGNIGLKRPFPNQIYRLTGQEYLNGSLLLDAIKTTNTKLGHHKIFVEGFDENGISQGREELH